MKKLLVLVTFGLFGFMPICDQIDREVSDINAEQNMLFSAYRDAQSARDHAAMADITTRMGENFWALEALERASYDNDCGHCGGGWTL